MKEHNVITLLESIFIFIVQGAQVKMANKKICFKSNIFTQTSQFMKFFVEKSFMLSFNPNLVFKTPN